MEQQPADRATMTEETSAERTRRWKQARLAVLPDAVKGALSRLPGISSRPDLAQRQQMLSAIQALAHAWGGVCLSNEYEATKTPMLFRCAKGHEFNTIPGDIRRGYWCSKCAYQTRTLTMTDMHTLARSHNGKCLSETYLGSKVRLEWQCEHGHVWKAVPAKIRSGWWCRKCSYAAMRTKVAELQVFAQARGGVCLAVDPIDSVTKILWQCARGHQWHARATGIKAGKWCPQCAILDRIHKKGSTARHKYEASRQHAVYDYGRLPLAPRLHGSAADALTVNEPHSDTPDTDPAQAE